MSQSMEKVVTECPACSERKIEMNAYDFANICSHCGLVITATGEPVASDVISPDPNDNATEKDDFRKVCAVTNDTESRLCDAFGTIEDIADQLPIPTETHIQAVDIFLESFRESITDGRERTCFISACIRLASVITSSPIPANKLIDAVDETSSEQFHRHCRVICSEIEKEVCVPTPAEYVWFLRTTDTISNLSDSIRQLLESAGEIKGLAGKDPAGIAAAGAYVVDDSLKQATAADVMGVSTETIRRRSKTLQQVLTDD